MWITGTECCALAQLSDVENTDTAEAIVRVAENLCEDKDHQKCLFTVTTPDEKVLEKTLASVGFKKTFLFPRVADKGMLTLWVTLVSDIKLKPKAAKRNAAKLKPRNTR